MKICVLCAGYHFLKSSFVLCRLCTRDEPATDEASAVPVCSHHQWRHQQSPAGQSVHCCLTGFQQETLKLSLIRLQTEPMCFFSQQDELTELKEQINLYESAIKHGALSLEPNGDWENHLSESYMDLGIKKSKWRNGRIHK